MGRFLVGAVLGAGLIGAAMSAWAQAGSLWIARLTVGNPDFVHPNAISFVGSATPWRWDIESLPGDPVTLTLHGHYVAPHFRMRSGGALYSAIVSAPIVTTDGGTYAVGTLAGVRAATPTVGAGADIWRTVGVLIESQATGGSGATWGIFQDGTDPNYLNGPTLLRQAQLLDEQGRWLTVEVGLMDSCGAGRRCVTTAN